VSSGFGGEIPALYQRYRRGYPPAVFDAIAASFELTAGDTVVDLGCGTGQLALPIAGRVRAVVGVDPEPGMLALARQAAAESELANLTWFLGTDADVPALTALLGAGSVGAVTIGQALHWMDHQALLPRLAVLVRPRGGVAVIANGTPLWLQDEPWSRALRAALEHHFGRPLTRTCGTDDATQHRYRTALTAAGFEVGQQSVEYSDDLRFDQLLGGVYSAMGPDQLPPDRPAFAARIRQAVDPETCFREHIRVHILTGRRPR
jgi:ubiquinone/menaquinone biosynthesis C-methylase UbiE